MALTFKLKLKFWRATMTQIQEDLMTNILKLIMSLRFWHSCYFLAYHS